MQEIYSKLNSTVHSTELVVKLVQLIVTEPTDRVLATQPCTVYPQPVTANGCQVVWVVSYRPVAV